MKQTIRIIGGLFRGKKLSFPVIQGLRPTPDRVRETLFNWLMNDIRHSQCLDAFAGSGALGFEAYSRGATNVIFIEAHPTAFVHLQKQIQAFNTPSLSALNIDTRDFLRQTKEEFDVIFLDPPFADNLLPECIAILQDSFVLKPHGLIYIEANHKPEMDERYWEPLKWKKAGQVTYGLFRKITNNSISF